jgi:hypothetical protein
MRSRSTVYDASTRWIYRTYLERREWEREKKAFRRRESGTAPLDWGIVTIILDFPALINVWTRNSQQPWIYLLRMYVLGVYTNKCHSKKPFQ